MNEDELLKIITKGLKKEEVETKKTISYKDYSSSVDNSNNNLIESKHPKNLFEIKEALERLKSLKKGAKGKAFLVKDEEIELRSLVSSGIVLDNVPHHDEIISLISNFLCSYGFDQSFVLDNLKNMEGHVLPVEFLYGGKAQSLRSHIDLELDFFDYDEEGKVIGVSEEKKDLYRHVVTHEFFHKLSSYKNGHRDIMVAGDVLLEGFTDLFTKLVLKESQIESDLYGFPVRICEMFTEIMGIDNVLDDYINHTGEFPKLKRLFNECGLGQEQFVEFGTVLSSVISGVSRDKKNDLSQQEWGIEEKNSSLDLLRNNIIIPYCRNNPDKAGNILNKFNNLFQDMGYSCSMEDVKEDKKM